MYCPPKDRRPANKPQGGNVAWEFYAHYTDGSEGTVKGMSTMNPARVRTLALNIARRNDVQCVVAVPVRI